MAVYKADDLMQCNPPAGCAGCAWSPVAEEVCSGVCIGEHAICPWLMACRCVNPDRSARRGHYLERLAMQQPPAVQVAPVDVPRSRIRVGEYEVRMGRDEKLVQGIARSIVENGLFAPPGGVAAEDGYVDIIMGTTRVLAMVGVLNWSTVPVRVFHWWGDDTWARKAMAFQENALRKQLTFDEEVALVYGYWRATGKSLRAMAKFFGMSKSWVEERVRWGVRMFEDRALPAGQSLAERRRAERVKRVSFTADEVRKFLGLLRAVGVDVSPDGNLRTAWEKALRELEVRANAKA